MTDDDVRRINLKLSPDGADRLERLQHQWFPGYERRKRETIERALLMAELLERGNGSMVRDLSHSGGN